MQKVGLLGSRSVHLRVPNFDNVDLGLSQACVRKSVRFIREFPKVWDSI